MYIDNIYFYVFSKRESREPRERYKQYYRDLHKRYHLPLDEKTLSEGSQYPFNELAYPIFNHLAADKILDKLDLIITTYWTNEFDSDYASFGTHLANRYQLNCKMFDVSDEGSICAITALKLIMQYQKNLTSQKSLCLAMQQTTVPRSQGYHYIIPEQSISTGLVLSSKENKKKYLKIIAIQSWTRQQLSTVKYKLSQLILNLLKSHRISIEHCIISCKMNSIFYRSCDYLNDDYFKPSSFYFLPSHYGCTDFFYLIHQMHHDSFFPTKPYILFIDEDVESLSAGLIIVQKDKNATQSY